MDRPISSHTLFKKLVYNNAELDCGNCTAVVGNTRIPLQRYLKTYPINTPVIELFMEICNAISGMRVETTDLVEFLPDQPSSQELSEQERQIITCLVTGLLKRFQARITVFHNRGQSAICLGLPSAKRSQTTSDTGSNDLAMLEKQYGLLAAERAQLVEKNKDVSGLTKSMDDLCIKIAREEGYTRNKAERIECQPMAIDSETMIRDNYKVLIDRQTMLNDALNLFNAGLDPGIGMRKDQIEAELTTVFLDMEAITSQYPESIWKPKPVPVLVNIPKKFEWGLTIDVDIDDKRMSAAELIKEPGFSWLRQLVNFAEETKMCYVRIDTSQYQLIINIRHVKDIHQIMVQQDVERFAGRLIPVVQSMIAESVVADFLFGGNSAQKDGSTGICRIYEVKTIQSRREIQVSTAQKSPGYEATRLF